jgi:hypothetical protein
MVCDDNVTDMDSDRDINDVFLDGIKLTDTDLGRIAFQAYLDKHRLTTEPPTWKKLSQLNKDQWIASALAIKELFTNER